jgi:hypothetical protein
MRSTTLESLLADVERRGDENFARYQAGAPGPWPCNVCGEPVEDFDSETGTPDSSHFSCSAAHVNFVPAESEYANFRVTSQVEVPGGRFLVQHYRTLYAAHSYARHLLDWNNEHYTATVVDARTSEVHFTGTGALPCRWTVCEEHAA